MRPTPTGGPPSQTRALLASMVVGHRRRLLDGQECSDAAAARAAALGITLDLDETWFNCTCAG